MIGHVDTPRPGERCERDAAVTGWVLWDEGIAVIEIAIDDTVLGAASLGYERLDVLTGRPSYGNQYFGWAAKIDLTVRRPGNSLAHGSGPLARRDRQASG
jgi:hypothetical protein